LNGGQLFSMRSGRITALGRAVMAVVVALSLLAAPIPTQFSDRVVSTLLVAYAVYSLAFLAATRSRGFVYRVLAYPMIPTAIDLIIFTIVIYMTTGARSPYFSPFFFLILSSTIQWGSRGAIVMGVLTTLAFAPAGWAAFSGITEPQGVQTFISRVGYVGVITVLLATFGRHVERVIEELSRLSRPLLEEGDDAGPPISQGLLHALTVFGARSGAFLWGEDEEPYLNLTVFDGAHVQTRRLTPGEEDPIDPAVSSGPFLYDRHGGGSFFRRGRATVPGPRGPLSQALLAILRFDRALVIPASTAGLSGWVFVFDHEEPANEDLAVGAMVGAQISVALERWESQMSRRAALAAEDRVRLARDLHDGVLQFLAGVRLQLDGLMAAGELPEPTRSQVVNLRESITDEHKELRGFISTLRPQRLGEADSQRALAEVLDELAGRLSRHWGVDVVCRVSSADLAAPSRLAYDIGRIVREAVANSVRHGKARHVTLEAVRRDEQLVIEISDDGCGFPFQGSRTDAELIRAGQGPRSLHERVRALAGRLTLDSTPKGAHLTIDLPLPEAG
jgi:signal transduction histidine kinase